jgi:hypothetical protein
MRTLPAYSNWNNDSFFVLPQHPHNLPICSELETRNSKLYSHARGAVAQLAERRVRNAEARSSTLLCSTKLFSTILQPPATVAVLAKGFPRFHKNTPPKASIRCVRATAFTGSTLFHFCVRWTQLLFPRKIFEEPIPNLFLEQSNRVA